MGGEYRALLLSVGENGERDRRFFKSVGNQVKSCIFV